MGKFLDKEKVLAALKAEMDGLVAAPGGKEVVQVQQYMLEMLQLMPTKLAAMLDAAASAAHDAHEKRIADLEGRLRTAESQSLMRYRGVWLPDQEYVPGDFVTDQGSMWHCFQRTHARPGEAAKDWLLAVKRGRDGRDAR